MIERHQNIKFAGGALVFPGGRLAETDHDPAWESHVRGIDTIEPEQTAPRIAAIREAFEETGILLAFRKGDDTHINDEYAHSLSAWRDRVEADDKKFLELVIGEGLELACNELNLFARWAPPKGVTNRRFNTWFFAAKAPADQIPREDGNEATDAIWTSPQDALNARMSGERKMIFPTVRNVELLNVTDGVATTLAFASTRKIELVQPAIIVRGNQKFVTIPLGLSYPTTEEPIETAFRT